MISLDHPGVVSIYETGSHQGLPYAVLQFLTGGSLGDRLAQAGRPETIDEVAQWLVPIAATLDSIHADGVLHRDIKPDNILFDRRGIPFLSDFGISKAIAEISGPSMAQTRTGMFVGSPRYMPPEYIDRRFSPACDQYSLATVAYLALTGHPPHEAETTERLLVDKATIVPELASEHVAGLAPDAVVALKKALSISPEDRFANCSAFAAVFQAAGAATDVTQEIAAPGKRRRWPVMTAAIGLLGVAAALRLRVGFSEPELGTPRSSGRAAVERNRIADESARAVPLAQNVKQPGPGGEQAAADPAGVASTPSATRKTASDTSDNSAPVTRDAVTREEVTAEPVKAEPAYLIIRSNVSGDTVAIDGVVLGGTDPTRREISAGRHTVRVEKPGYTPYEQTLVVDSATTQTLHVALELTAEGMQARRVLAEQQARIAKAAQEERERNAEAARKARAAQQESERKAEASRKAKARSADSVQVSAGSFYYGCNEPVDKQCDSDEKPGGQRTLAAFWIDRTEVTVAAYRSCVAAGSCTEPSSGRSCTWSASGRSGLEQHPINCVDWEQARKYCVWKGKRLPSEQEWEKAARGTDGRKYPWGNSGFNGSRRLANIADVSAKREHPNWTVAEGYDDGYAATSPVGSFPAGASPGGAVDMAGNVWEWTSDWYDSKREGRVIRGGSWNGHPSFARASYRHGYDPGYRFEGIGLRCAQCLPTRDASRAAMPHGLRTGGPAEGVTPRILARGHGSFGRGAKNHPVPRPVVAKAKRVGVTTLR